VAGALWRDILLAVFSGVIIVLTKSAFMGGFFNGVPQIYESEACGYGVGRVSYNLTLS